MRIAINAHLLSTHSSYRQAGVSNYIHQVVMNVPRLDPGNDYVVFLGPAGASGETLATNVTPVVSALPTWEPAVRIFWEQAFQPLSLRAHDVDLVHCPMHVAPFLSIRRKVITVHDLAFLAHPETHKRANRLYLSLFTRWSLPQARSIIAVSESTRRELRRRLGVSPERVTVVYNGVDARFVPQPAEAVRSFRHRLGLPDRFILFVGTLEPRKNVEALVRAFAMARENLAEGTKLVLAGGKGWGYREVLQTIEDLGLGEDTILPGFVPDPELPLWYSAAALFVYPSLYEGFGLPPLEAMACGTPVVASNSSSLPEVVGDGGVLVDPADYEGLAEAIVGVLSDPARRDGLVERGLRRAQRFSWLSTAEETKKVYVEALRG